MNKSDATLIEQPGRKLGDGEISPKPTEHLAQNMARVAVVASNLVQGFSEVKRVPRRKDGERESDTEHSYMLGVVSLEIANMLNKAGLTSLNIDTIRRYPPVHDWPEIKTGDMATFDVSEEQLKKKEELEAQAMVDLKNEYGILEQSILDLEEYNRQKSLEARFVRMVDKLMPLAMDITGDGVRVVKEDYGIKSESDLQNAHKMIYDRLEEAFGKDFPSLLEAHKVLSQWFEDKFEKEQNSREMVHGEVERGPIEVERKYLVEPDKLPSNLEEFPNIELEQSYVAIGADGSETRVRSFDNERFELTIKGPGDIKRTESTIEISEGMYRSLLDQSPYTTVRKTRYFVPIAGGEKAELDIYKGDLKGLVTVEVEFGARESDAMLKADTFKQPDWFGRDVSEDIRYKNHMLAQEGIPGEMPVLGAKRY